MSEVEHRVVECGFSDFLGYKLLDIKPLAILLTQRGTTKRELKIGNRRESSEISSLKSFGK